MPISSALLVGLSKLSDLTEDNWGVWSKTFLMFFRGCGASYIVDGGAVPADKTDLDGELVWTIFSHVHADYQGLIEDEKSGAAAWRKLTTRFEKSNMSRRLKARSDFYHAVHDPALPVDVYITRVKAARKLLKGLKCEPGDIETADVLLLNLHPSWDTVRTTITSNKDEQRLDDVIAILNGSVVRPPIKEEDDTVAPLAMAASRLRLGSGAKQPYASRAGTGRADRQAGAGSNAPAIGAKDDKGYQWCDPTNENHCHRCGRSGHIAARCIHDMPQHIKDWVMGNLPREQTENARYTEAPAYPGILDEPGVDSDDDEGVSAYYPSYLNAPIRI